MLKESIETVIPVAGIFSALFSVIVVLAVVQFVKTDFSVVKALTVVIAFLLSVLPFALYFAWKKFAGNDRIAKLIFFVDFVWLIVVAVLLLSSPILNYAS